MLQVIRDGQPGSLLLIALTMTCVALALVDRRNAAALVGLAAVAVGLELGRFDGRPVLTDELDATSFFWARAVTLRILAGACTLVVAGVVGLPVSARLGSRRAFLLGLATIGPIGLGTLISGLALYRAIEPRETPGEVLRALRGAAEVSDLALAGCAVAAMVVSATVAVRLRDGCDAR